MINNKTVAIVFPCKNEAKTITSLLSNIPKYIDQVIVVDNRSSDNTASIAKKNGATVYKDNRHLQKVGYGFAINTGIKKANSDYIIIMDGDKTYPLTYIKKIINTMNKNSVDFVSCKRFPLNKWNDMTPIRFIGGKILTIIANLLFGCHISDILSGMWIFRKNIIPYLDLRPGDWNMSLSIKLSAVLSPYINFSEFHIPYHDRCAGQSKQHLLKTGLLHLIYLVKLKYEYFIKSNSKIKKIYSYK